MPKFEVKALVLIFLCFLSSYGCDFRRLVVNQPTILEGVEGLRPGQSTMQEVVDVLGAPDSISKKPDGMVFQYRYGDTKAMRINFGWLFRFFIPVTPSMNLGRGEGVTQVLHVSLDQKATFEQYVIQDPPEPPSFSFWPF